MTWTETSPWTRLFVVVAVVASGACGGESGSSADNEAGAGGPPQPAAADTGPAAAPGTAPLTATLEPVDESGVEGQATAIPDRDSVQLNLMVQGLPSEGEYTAQVHKGSCETGGPVAFTLTPVRSDRDGLGRSSTALLASSLAADESYFVQVERASKPLACGDVQGRD